MSAEALTVCILEAILSQSLDVLHYSITGKFLLRLLDPARLPSLANKS